jgi:hypothetical protein
MPEPVTVPPLGFGLGLRTVHYEEILAGPCAVDWFELLSENYMVPGGKPLHFLDRIRAQLNAHAQGKVIFIAREQLAALEKERRMKQTGQVTSSSEPNVVEFKGADFFLTGKLSGLSTRTSTGVSDYILYTFQLIDARTSDIVWEDSAEIKKQGLRGSGPAGEPASGHDLRTGVRRSPRLGRQQTSPLDPYDTSTEPPKSSCSTREMRREPKPTPEGSDAGGPPNSRQTKTNFGSPS